MHPGHRAVPVPETADGVVGSSDWIRLDWPLSTYDGLSQVFRKNGLVRTP
jgi:hypothetical protein